MTIWEFGLALAIFFMAIYLISDPVQQYLYDQIVTGLAWRSLLAAAPLAFLINYAPMHFHLMFTEQFLWTLAHCAAWILMLRLFPLYYFNHAIMLGTIMAVVLGPLVTMAVFSLTGRDVQL